MVDFFVFLTVFASLGTFCVFLSAVDSHVFTFTARVLSLQIGLIYIFVHSDEKWKLVMNVDVEKYIEIPVLSAVSSVTLESSLETADLC